VTEICKDRPNPQRFDSESDAHAHADTLITGLMTD